MTDILKELFEDYDDIPLWVYPILILATLSFFPIMTLFIIVLGG